VPQQQHGKYTLPSLNPCAGKQIWDTYADYLKPDFLARGQQHCTHCNVSAQYTTQASPTRPILVMLPSRLSQPK